METKSELITVECSYCQDRMKWNKLKAIKNLVVRERFKGMNFDRTLKLSPLKESRVKCEGKHNPSLPRMMLQSLQFCANCNVVDLAN